MVGEQFAGGTAKSEEDQGTEDVVLDDAGQQFRATSGHRLHEDFGHRRTETGRQVPVSGTYLLLTMQIEQDGAPVTLVHEFGPLSLEHHTTIGTRKPRGGIDRFLLGRGACLPQTGNVIAGEELVGISRTQPAAGRDSREEFFREGACP